MAISTEEFIRSRAKLNWSRAMVADALGVDYQKFLGVARLMPGVVWPGPNESVVKRQSAESRKGVCTPGLHKAAAIAREARYSRAKKHVIGSFTGTTREAFDFWRDQISVTYCQVRRRLAKGVNTLDAFFKPNETHLGWGQNGKFWRD
jgi:hypothetical protein